MDEPDDWQSTVTRIHEQLRNELRNRACEKWRPVLADVDKHLTDGLQRARDVAKDAISTWRERRNDAKSHMRSALIGLFPEGDAANALYSEITSGMISEQQLARLSALIMELDLSPKTHIDSVTLEAVDVSAAAAVSNTDGAKEIGNGDDRGETEGRHASEDTINSSSRVSIIID
jgi:hypothetical protein